MKLPALLTALSAAFLLWLTPRTGRAEPLSYPEPPAVLWQRQWPTFGRAEGVATVAAGVGTGVLFVLKPPQDPRWQGGILFDDDVRGALRLKSASARQRVRALGDLPYYAAPAIPLVIDPLLAWLARDDAKTALNLELVSLEAFSYAGLLSFVSTRASVRERPDATECRKSYAEGAQTKPCEPDTESFYSGHTTIAAASAGIVCANHRAMPLWGHPAADVGACALATTGAVASGVSRLAADRHYATDVIAGFGMGFGIGYAIPTLLHYAREDTQVSLSIAPGGPCTGACLKLSGSF
jgi:membrane-associated phospholipid phosphatase